MGWHYYVLAGGIVALSVMVVLLYTRIKVLESQASIVLESWRKATEAAAAAKLNAKAYDIALMNKQKMEAFEEWAKALTQHASADVPTNLQDQIQEIIGMGQEDYEKDLEIHGFNADPTFNPEDTV